MNRLQLIKFWPSHHPTPPGRGSAVGHNFDSTLLQPVHTVCISSEHFFSFCLLCRQKVEHKLFKMLIQVTFCCLLLCFFYFLSILGSWNYSYSYWAMDIMVPTTPIWYSPTLNRLRFKILYKLECKCLPGGISCADSCSNAT